VRSAAFYNQSGFWEERKKNFIWIRRNPLKSPDSAKEKQGNASLFAWFYLVFLAFSCFSLEEVLAPSCIRRASPAIRS
jgi:hypothetical protein